MSPSSVTAMFMTLGGAIILGALFPFVASMVLDGGAALLRGKGVKPLLLTVVLAAIVGIGGWIMWKSGVNAALEIDSLAALPENMRSTARMLLSISIPLALFAFAIRQVKQLLSRRR